MLPTLEQLGITIDRFEIESLGPACVRLVAWSGSERQLTLTADPRDPDALSRLLEVPQVFLSSQAGVDRVETWKRIRGKRNGQNEHGR